MKKFLVLSLVTFFILAFGSAYAQEKAPVLEFKASGFIDAITELWRNVTPGNGGAGIYNVVSSTYQPGGAAFDKTNSYLETRARLKFDAIMGKEVSGTIYFEMDSSRWGEVAGTGAQRNQMGYWSADRAAVEVKNVYIDFGVPVIPVPTTMRVGLQALAIRPNLLVYTDGMGVTMGIKVDPLTIAPLWFKALENKDYASDDADVYGLHVNAKVQTFTIGGYGLYYKMNTYPLAAGDVTNRADFWWVGGYLDGKAGPVNLNFDLIFDDGKVKSKTPGVRDIDYSGWATRLKVDYPWEKFNVGVVGMYASGADTNKTDSTGLPGGTNTKVGSYVTPPASESFGAFGESLVFYSSWVNRGNTGLACTGNYTRVSRGPLGGTWMGKLYGSMKVTPEYKVTLAALYIGDTTDKGNTIGTARKADGVTLRDDSEIGWEFDIYNEFQIYKNLKYTLAGGFMTKGDGLEFWDSATSSNKKPSTPWIVTSNLTYTF